MQTLPAQVTVYQTTAKKNPKNQLDVRAANFQHYATIEISRTSNAENLKTTNRASFVENLTKSSSKNAPHVGGGLGGAGSPIEILKRFKMQKQVSQLHKKVNLTTVEDETVNEQDLPADDGNQEDIPFRQTVFNPEPSKMLSPRRQQL